MNTKHYVCLIDQDLIKQPKTIYLFFNVDKGKCIVFSYIPIKEYWDKDMEQLYFACEASEEYIVNIS